MKTNFCSFVLFSYQNTQNYECGAKPIPENLKEKSNNAFLKYQKTHKTQSNHTYEFDVYWHVISHTNGTGNITDEQIDITMDLLNQGFSGKLIDANTDCFGNPVSGIETSIRFVLKGVD